MAKPKTVLVGFNVTLTGAYYAELSPEQVAVVMERFAADTSPVPLDELPVEWVDMLNQLEGVADEAWIQKPPKQKARR